MNNMVNIDLSAQPIGSQIASGESLSGYNWNLWKGSNSEGSNSTWDIYSFIATEGDINNFSGDLNPFFRESRLSVDSAIL